MKTLAGLLLLLLIGCAEWLFAANINKIGTLLEVEGKPGCYSYAGFSNGHIVRRLDTDVLEVYYVRRLIPVTICGEQ